MKSQRRIRTEKEAVQYLNDNVSSLSSERRRSAMARIRFAKQPNVEAKRIIQKYHLDKASSIAANDQIDLSDTEELRVRLFRRDSIIEEPHISLLESLERDIIICGMTTHEFKRRSSHILSIPSALPKRMRQAEMEYLKE